MKKTNITAKETRFADQRLGEKQVLSGCGADVAAAQ